LTSRSSVVRIYPLLVTMMFVAIFVSTLVALAIGQACPSSDYIPCNEHEGSYEHCIIPDRIKEGYMSYGIDGRYNLVPFTNDHTDGTDLWINCDNDLGDIYPGKPKQCCYIAADTGFSAGEWEGNKKEGEYWTLGGLWSMRYGMGSRFVYRVIEGEQTKGWCGNNFFNDPAPWHTKYCNYWEGVPPAANHADDEWISCGNEGGECQGLNPNAAQWVRYGDDDRYNFRLVISTDGKIPCNNDMFNDPVSGNAFCQRAPVDLSEVYTFTDVIGKWEQLPSCTGCSSNAYKVAYGVTELESSTVTNEFSTSFKSELSAGFSIWGNKMSYKLTSTVGAKVASSMKSSISKTYSESTSMTCTKDRLYQWSTEAKFHTAVLSKAFAVRADTYLCINGQVEPQCAPGFCADEQCQTCNYDSDGEEDDCCNYCGVDTVNAEMEPIRLSMPVRAEPASFAEWTNEWTLSDWYHAHYDQVILFLAVLLVISFGLNLYVMVSGRGHKKRAYVAVKYMASDTEVDVEARPIKN